MNKEYFSARKSLVNRRLILSLLVLFAIALFFWTQSRVPDLSDKAMMGGSILLQDPLSFEATYPLNPADPVWKRIVTTSVNWVFTNMRGMLFGVLFGAAFLTMLRYLAKKSFKGNFANAFLGLFVGAPLGVCVNCAAPIARGLFSGGARLETTLAAMIASPTFNVIVLTMLLSLLPLYLVVIKIVFSLIIILLAIPLICRALPVKQLVSTDQGFASCPIPNMDELKSESLFSALGNYLLDYCRDLWYIVRITVPLMFLAGLLGAALATLLPVTMIESMSFNLLAVTGIVALGLFLPVPIAFDVILATVLLATGAPVGLVMALLFTLGIFSVYSYMIVAGSISARAANALVIVIAFVGIGVAYIAQAYSDWEYEQTIDELGSHFSFNLVSSVHAAELSNSPNEVQANKKPTITISPIPFVTRSTAAEKPFTRLEAWKIGIDRPNLFSMADMTVPFMQAPGSIAAADIDNDGDQDVIMGESHGGIKIFHNDGKGVFKEFDLNIAQVNALPVFQAAPADINNDGWLDLVITTFAKGEYILYSDKGLFSGKNVKKLPNRQDARHVLALGVGDLNRDGELDLVLGNHSGLPTFMAKGEFDRNRIFYNNNGQFTPANVKDTSGVPGETLSILLSDFNQDGYLDLIEGNDFTEPDIFYTGNKAGELVQITTQDNIIPVTTLTTMSVKTADLNNNGMLEIYLSQIAGRTNNVAGRLNLQSWDTYCSEMEREQDQKTCEKNLAARDWLVPGFMRANPKMVQRCKQFPFPERRECRALLLRNTAFRRNMPELCERIGNDQEKLMQMCRYITASQRLAGKRGKAFPKDGEKKIHINEQDFTHEIPQHFGGNVLLANQVNGQYKDVAEQANLEIGGWSWDVKIYDFDNDGLQDIHIVNGDWILKRVTPSNLFMHNLGDLKFIDKAPEFGLVDYKIITSAAAADFDNDGDIDEIAQSVNGPVIAYWNNTQTGSSIAFEFRDHIGNHYGVANKVRITYGENDEFQQLRELNLSGGYGSYDAPMLHFGLGEIQQINSFDVQWSTGENTHHKGPFKAGATYQIQRL